MKNIYFFKLISQLKTFLIFLIFQSWHYKIFNFIKFYIYLHAFFLFAPSFHNIHIYQWTTKASCIHFIIQRNGICTASRLIPVTLFAMGKRGHSLLRTIRRHRFDWSALNGGNKGICKKQWTHIFETKNMKVYFAHVHDPIYSDPV